MILQASGCVLRPYRMGDLETLAMTANDADVSRYLRRRFPHPYRLQDAYSWLTFATAQGEKGNFAIEVHGKFAGGIGLDIYDAEHTGVAEVGYWLGKAYWGKGVATAALQAVVDYGFSKLGQRRIQASVMSPNLASCRVLEKCRFIREAVLKNWYVGRDGEIYDGVIYARLTGP